jgi:replicative DNA helicase
MAFPNGRTPSRAELIVMSGAGLRPEDNPPSDLYAPDLARLRPGGSWVLDAPLNVPAVWGSGDDVLWSEGEALLLCGPSGVGKTTLTGQLIHARMGQSRHVLGYPVKPGGRRVLYLAMDRPAQVARSIRRQFGEDDRSALDELLTVWSGPPPADLANDTGLLARMCREADADTVVVDSLKDAAVGLTDDKVGASYNRARQRAIGDGMQVVELHHQVKRGANGGEPNTLADVYGSVWLTAGAGSVIVLWGASGDPIVRLTHLKPPVSEVGPLRVIHEGHSGRSAIYHATDLVLLALANPGGITAKAAARAVAETDKPTANDVEKARRRLRALTYSGDLVELSGQRGGAAGAGETRWMHVTHHVPSIDELADADGLP